MSVASMMVEPSQCEPSQATAKKYLDVLSVGFCWGIPKCPLLSARGRGVSWQMSLLHCLFRIVSFALSLKTSSAPEDAR